MAAMDASQIIDEFGGPVAVAKRLGAGRTAVYNWRRDGIPAKFWLPLLDAAKAEGKGHITPEALAWRPRRETPEAVS